ncbi:MAG: thiamine phosphate synthase [Vicinamibacterales bacterium]|jgi:thiamine-phosphate pyrophosphorylase|nr:thiamine phosphate synthase [Vicinamibacterales bacterium]HJO18578.1 thiamine phosphate synthase [Vicinamibacterales bacterium]|tara:strand:+ start:1029 stop:1658 length:630 start_codon:yes stop_codon:yes gene_type:complete
MPLSPLYAIVDADVSSRHGWEVTQLAEAVMRGGARLVQLRAKSVSSKTFMVWADTIVNLGIRYGASIILNDRADLVRLSGARGLHLGQEDLPVDAARQIVGPEALIGLSTHTLRQLNVALSGPTSYVAVGPVFETQSKTASDAVVGLEFVAQAAERVKGVPLVGIGGITLERARSVICAGATSVAVISDLLTGGNPERRAAEFLDALTD